MQSFNLVSDLLPNVDIHKSIIQNDIQFLTCPKKTSKQYIFVAKDY